MRILLKIKPKEIFVYNEINNYFIQSFIWNTLKGTDYAERHDEPKFKFFTFSNIFPITDFNEKETKNFIIASPDENFIKTIDEKLKDIRNFKLGIHEFELISHKPFSIKLKERWETATPIVLYENNKENIYYSIRRNPDLNFFLERLKENTLKKYNSFYNENLNFDKPIFDRLFFKKQVALKFRKNQREFIIIGTLWEFEINLVRNKNLEKFYKFILDCGLGEKNSFGFGFVNPAKKNSEKAIMTYEGDE